MTKFLSRPDEGYFFNLQAMPENIDDPNATFLDRQADMVATKVDLLNKDVPSKLERTNHFNVNNNDNMHYHKESRAQQEEWINRLSKYKELKRSK